MRTFTGIVCHTDSPNLTYHDSVDFPDVVPLVVDFNDKRQVGRAKITRAEGHIYADLFLDQDVDELFEPPLALCATQGSTVFDSENGTNYVMDGHLSQISLVTESALQHMLDGTYEPTEEELSKDVEPAAA